MSDSPVTLKSDLSNIQQFIPSLFASGVRDQSKVEKALYDGKLHYLFADDDSTGVILNTWLETWKQAQGESDYSAKYADHCPPTDRWFIEFLSRYIKENDLCLFTPDLEWGGSNAPNAYRAGDHVKAPFLTNGKWNYGKFDSKGKIDSSVSEDKSAVVEFLRHFYYGAHFVVVTCASDYKAGAPRISSLYSSIENAITKTIAWVSDLPKQSSLHLSDDEKQEDRWVFDVLNSHYATNKSGVYYLDIRKDAEPADNPLIAALLIGTTVHGSDQSKANSFIQLEGWHNTGPFGWHAKDYDTHKATKWNFATFGACAYSEKRCTPMFIAGSTFDTKRLADTKMPSYAGATSKQDWMETDLLIVS
ncbi:MAG TPA: hypothetical protein VFN10_02800 [Thermoanaerobaculia bacterium]|nr:hypothetical protein [Thermoanaerobaculia bacterium]